MRIRPVWSTVAPHVYNNITPTQMRMVIIERARKRPVELVFLAEQFEYNSVTRSETTTGVEIDTSLSFGSVTGLRRTNTFSLDPFPLG
eukprot:247965-Prorocentrum_minimum.AAC.4